MHNELIQWWCEEAYPKKYGASYMFQGAKEAALLKKAIVYFKNNKDLFQDAATSYLNDMADSYVVENKHPFSCFLSKPHKWAGKRTTPRPRPISELNHLTTYHEVHSRWEKVSPEAYAERAVSEAKDNPERFFRGFRTSSGFLKAAHPEAWRKVMDALVDLLGRERARVLWKESGRMI